MSHLNVFLHCLNSNGNILDRQDLSEYCKIQEFCKTSPALTRCFANFNKLWLISPLFQKIIFVLFFCLLCLTDVTNMREKRHMTDRLQNMYRCSPKYDYQGPHSLSPFAAQSFPNKSYRFSGSPCLITDQTGPSKLIVVSIVAIETGKIFMLRKIKQLSDSLYYETLGTMVFC